MLAMDPDPSGKTNSDLNLDPNHGFGEGGGIFWKNWKK